MAVVHDAEMSQMFYLTYNEAQGDNDGGKESAVRLMRVNERYRGLRDAYILGL